MIDLRCRFWWHYYKQINWIDTSLFNMSPLEGHRVCLRCGREEEFHWDSQGGYWTTAKEAPNDAT